MTKTQKTQRTPASVQDHPQTTSSPKSKLALLVDLLSRPEGASLAAMSAATGWQTHSIRGAMAGSLKKKGCVVISSKTEQGRIYHIAPETGA